jgi:hypothetical protein
VKKLILIPLILLAGCTTIRAVPVTAKFPDAPETLMQQCAKLKEATEGMTLTEYTKTVVDNYMLYHECERKVQGWHEWYAAQKKIFEEATTKK